MNAFAKIYADTVKIDNIDLGAAAGVGFFVDSDYVSRDLVEMGVFDDYWDDTSEVRFMLKLEFFLDEIDFVMKHDFDKMINEEDLYLHLRGMIFDIQKNYEKFMYNYMVKVKEAHIEVMNKMLANIQIREEQLIDIDIDNTEIDDIKSTLIALKNIELYKEELENLPIFD